MASVFCFKSYSKLDWGFLFSFIRMLQVLVIAISWILHLFTVHIVASVSNLTSVDGDHICIMRERLSWSSGCFRWTGSEGAHKCSKGANPNAGPLTAHLYGAFSAQHQQSFHLKTQPLNAYNCSQICQCKALNSIGKHVSFRIRLYLVSSI